MGCPSLELGTSQNFLGDVESPTQCLSSGYWLAESTGDSDGLDARDNVNGHQHTLTVTDLDHIRYILTPSTFQQDSEDLREIHTDIETTNEPDVDEIPQNSP